MMDAGMISKIEKSKIYAEEGSERISFEVLRARVHGDNNSDHIVEYNEGEWKCDSVI